MSDRWSRLRSLYLRALELPGEEQARFVRAEARGDPELEAEVRDMLAPSPPDAPLLEPLSLPRGGYDDIELLEEIGSGGMGVVYRARQVSLGREVAVKVLREQPELTDALVTRFREEAERASQLRHPNIVPIFTVGRRDEDPHFVMQHVPGGSLQELLDQARERRTEGEEDPGLARELHPGQVATILAGIADALQCAHDAGLIHRDVKPSNILLDEAGRPYLVDFGIAGAVEVEARTSAPLGTLAYMSPEQARVRETPVDHRTDVYSLGVVGFELLTLRPPFSGETPEELFRAIREHPAPRIRKLNRRVPADLETICLKALEKDPDERYATARELEEDLRRFLAHEAPLADPPGPLRRLRRRFRQHREPILVVLTALAVSLGAWLYLSKSSDPRLTLTLAPGSVASGEAPPRIVAVPLDPVLGLRTPDPPLELGVAPLIEVPVTPGYYLIRVLGPDDRQQELFAALWGRDENLVFEDVELHATSEVVGDMLSIPAGPFEYGANLEKPLEHWPSRVEELPAFYIDATEVTNADYKLFLDAVEERRPELRPKFWPEDYREIWTTWAERGWDRLPVMGVSARDADAYAQWAGKRLPTAFEWQRAARGNEGRRYPWGNEDSSAPGHGNTRRAPLTVADRWERYVTYVQPPRSQPHDRTPEGAFDMLGNLQEWTASYAEFLIGEDWTVSRESRVVCGGAFLFDEIALSELLSQGMSHRPDWTGFRCARSAE